MVDGYKATWCGGGANNIHTCIKLDHVVRVKRWAVNSWKWVTTGQVAGTRVETQAQDLMSTGSRRNVGPDLVGTKKEV